MVVWVFDVLDRNTDGYIDPMENVEGNVGRFTETETDYLNVEWKVISLPTPLP